ncbi:MAG: ABC transporter permease [Gammaproteobacteria bacterium]|nr:ABC transporter permease [Gammaproteobacteria bacterium]MDE0224021.1 ABC transporter permease [Gammaproteobacteria bacterium]MDE0450643.1 ABC transporter permease [Gammaproteobacteria bacterium]
MSLFELVRVSFDALRVNLLRSVLTMLGIVIGVAAVIAMVTVGAGAQAEVDRQIEALGSNVLMIRSGSRWFGGARTAAGSAQSLTVEDTRALKAEIPEIAAAASANRGSGQVVVGNMNWSTTIYGIDADYMIARNWELAQGREFEPAEFRNGAKVALLGNTVVEELFGAGNVVGQAIRIKNVPFTVVGALKAKGQSFGPWDQDDTVMVPFKTAEGRLLGKSTHRTGSVRDIYVSVGDADAMDLVELDITEVLRQRHRIGPGEQDTFSIRNMTEMVEARVEARQIFNMLLAAVASVSLVVGGIGIMNIMLVSVTERTREIGLRMAVGAKERDIMLQFLVEAVTLCLLGGLIGIVVALTITVGVAEIAGWPVLVQWPIVIIAIAFSAAIGIFFGFYPARKAAAKDPIEALRSE